MNENGWKVLIIDDEEGIRKVLAIALQDRGYEVITAGDGETGLGLCRKESPQIVITDVRMPGMDGIEILRQVKEQDPDKEVIVVTAFGEMETAIRALRLGASDFILKPIDDDALFVALDRAKTRAGMRRELKEYTSLIETRLMATAAELAKTFDFQQNLIESSIDGIMACDREGRVVTYNRSMEVMTGFPRKDVLGRMHFERFFPVGSVETLKEAVDSEEFGGRNRLFLYETSLLTRDGKKVPVQLSLTRLFQDGEEVGFVGFFRDLREIRRLERRFADQARVLHQHKMMSLGRLAASVVHEINNPLAGILNYLRLMQKILNRGAPGPEHLDKFKQYLSLVESETDRCSKIVSNLLAFSRKSKTEFRTVNVNELLQKCILLSGHKLALQNIELRTELSPANPLIEGDFNQIQQCVINLIFNAVDAMPEGGTLTMSSSLEPREGIVEIRVADTGRGIPPEDLPHIFDPFFSTKTEGEGLGLGLSTVYGIVDRHKGTVHVESRPGMGTVFTLKIPVSLPEGAEGPRA